MESRIWESQIASTETLPGGGVCLWTTHILLESLQQPCKEDEDFYFLLVARRLRPGNTAMACLRGQLARLTSKPGVV